MEPRKGTASTALSEAEFKKRFKSAYRDPAFDALADELDRLAGAAWDSYRESRKSPHTAKAGTQYHDPDYELARDWLDARAAIEAAQQRHEQALRPHVLLINASPRNEHTCPGEMSKSYRLAQFAAAVFRQQDIAVAELDLSRLTSEYGLRIHPCKSCFSTAAALCHWPCSCYPNYALGQTQDWMNEIFPLWVEAHGVMIVTPVHWFQATSPLKLMMDRLVCADGGNPDPTRTHGKDVALAKEVELQDWPYPRHLAGRLFSVVVHGDAEGAEQVLHALSDWMSAIGMRAAGSHAGLARYIGYWKPYATSHNDLDVDTAVQEEVRNAARTLAEAVIVQHKEQKVDAGSGLREPRKK